MKRILLTATLGLLAANAVAETEEHDYSIGTGEGILVCVFDGSVNTHHKALRDAKIDGIHDISIGQYDRASSASDHGTTMASLMLKHAPQADYFYIPGFGPNLTGNQQNEKFKTAIEVCLNKGADIISIPGGTPSYDVEVERLMLKARNAGALVLAAAGNHGKPGQETVYHQYPASYPTTLSIGAVGMSESAGIIPWEHSAVNPRLDLVALGVDLPSALTSEDGQSFYGVSSGTSQATAISAGLIAQVWSNHRDCNADNIYSVMKSTALEYPEQRFGSGFIDVKAADNALSKHGCSGGLDATTDEWYYLEAYDGGDEVAYKGDIYLAKHWTKNEEPGLSDVWIATGETQEFDENKILNRYNLNSVKNQVHYVPSGMDCIDSPRGSNCTVTRKCNDWTLNCGRGNVNLGPFDYSVSLAKGIHKAGTKLNKQNQSKGYNKKKMKQLNNVLRNFKTEVFDIDGLAYHLTKERLEHILIRHHPKYWSGEFKNVQSFFSKDTSVNDIMRIIESILRQNKGEISKRRKTTYIGRYGGKIYVLGFIRQGGIVTSKIGQFYPKD